MTVRILAGAGAFLIIVGVLAESPAIIVAGLPLVGAAWLLTKRDQ